MFDYNKMGWFDKEKKEVRIPALPELPKLPEWPKFEGVNDTDIIHQLPTFPSNPINEKFSQNTIKEAVAGKKEDDIEDADEFAEDKDYEMQMMQKPLKKNFEPEIESVFRKEKIYEPIFIRIDKFEESVHILEKIKKQILEVEKLLADTKRLKEKEEKELESWEKEMRLVKIQIDKIDKNLFSKIQ